MGEYNTWLVEHLAARMSPTLFGGKPDDKVGPGTRYARDELRRHARAILDSGLVVPAADRDAAVARAEAAEQAMQRVRDLAGTYSQPIARDIRRALDGTL